MKVLDLLFGKRLRTEDAESQRIGPLTGVSLLGLDALASAAYGPEALLTVLLPLGAASLDYVGLLTLPILVVLGLVFLSYRQTTAAYPQGGGAYSVVRDNLGTALALVAAAALTLDYVLNAAVAVSAGVGALVSMVPALIPHTLGLCLALLALLTLVNLRGVREAGLVFLTPAYLFSGCLMAVIGIGIQRYWAAGARPLPLMASATATPGAGALSGTVSTWLLLRAFASGCTAMTGVEAVSNAVPVFREPAVPKARRTLTLIVGILAILLAGVAFLSMAYRVQATTPGSPEYRSVISQVVAAVVGRGPFYYVTMVSVVSVLALSANTSFAAFPRLCRILAADRYLPEPLTHRGRRLTFSHGILVLSVLAGLLLVLFHGLTDPLIPFFAVGALLAFTLSQAAMVVHWRKQAGKPAVVAMATNATGAMATGATLCVVAISKFVEGAWLSLLLIGGFFWLFRAIHGHYRFIEAVTEVSGPIEYTSGAPPLVVVPLRRWNAVALKAVTFAMRLSDDVSVLQVETRDRDLQPLRDQWRQIAELPALAAGRQPPKLTIVESRYRELAAPVLNFVQELAVRHPDRQIAVVVPELVETRWFHYFLHNQSAAFLSGILLLQGGPQIIVVNMPWYLREWVPERRRLRALGRWLARERGAT